MWRWWREDDLTIPTFLLTGKNHASARDEFIYSYFVRPRNVRVTQEDFGLAVLQPGAIFLARVPKDRIFVGRDAYEWFSGMRHGQATWGALASKQPVPS